jgi:hypothetical protein
MKALATARTKELRSVLYGDVKKARTKLLEHTQRIVVESDGKIYVTAGMWDFFGSDLGMVPGARIELATPAFSGRRSTSELPRHSVHLV